MFSRALFKQSSKANGLMWGIITFAVCFMLACVMMISGNGNISVIKNSVEDTIIVGEIDSALEKRAINNYKIAKNGMQKYNEYFVKNLTVTSGDVTQAAGLAASELEDYILEQAKKIDNNITKDSSEFKEMYGAVMFAINPSNMFDEAYANHNETVPETYNFISLVTKPDYLGSDEEKSYITNRADYACPIFIAHNMTLDENVGVMIEALADYGITKEKYDSFGYTYEALKHSSKTTIISYQTRFDYEMELLQEKVSSGEISVENLPNSIIEMDTKLSGSLSQSLLSSLPESVSNALQEIGKMDLYSLIIGSIFYKMAGLLLPIIFMIMVSNNLIASQVDSGSMAYILSTSTKRKQVVFTQAVYLIVSLFAMLCCTTITSVVCLAILNDSSLGLTYGKLILLNLGAFITLFAMSGICFMASCWFDRSKRSMAIGGGLSMFFLVATMLGLFGSKVIPSVVRLDALNNFNYVTIISLFDAVSIIGGTTTFIWKLAILLVIGVAGYIAGSIKFQKKDLPL